MASCGKTMKQTVKSSSGINHQAGNTDRQAHGETAHSRQENGAIGDPNVNHSSASKTKGCNERDEIDEEYDTVQYDTFEHSPGGAISNNFNRYPKGRSHTALQGGVHSGPIPTDNNVYLEETAHQQQQKLAANHHQAIKPRRSLWGCVRSNVHHIAGDPKLEKMRCELKRTKEELSAEKKKVSEKDQELKKCKEFIDQHVADKLSHPTAGAQQVGQTFLTLGKIRDRIKATMDNIVNRWTETIVEMGESQEIQDAGSIPRVLLPTLFLVCLNEVTSSRRSIVCFFLGSRGDRREEDMEPATATFMLEHMRQHQSTLFPVKAGEAVHNEARGRVLEYIIGHLTKELHVEDHELATNLINDSGTEKIVDAYFEIIVNMELQDPPAVFTEECGEGTVQFDPNRHETSHVDGGAFSDPKNKMCTVVFPALVQSKKEQLPWMKSFIIEG